MESSTIFLRIIEKASRISGKTYGEGNQLKPEGYTYGYNVVVKGNIDNVAGGKAADVDLSSYKEPNGKDRLGSTVVGAMKEQVAADLIASMLKTVRFERENGKIYISFSIPKMPEGYGIYIDPCVWAKELAFTVKTENGMSSQSFYLEGNYRTEIYISERFESYKASIECVGLSGIMVGYIYKVSSAEGNAWVSAKYSGGVGNMLGDKNNYDYHAKSSMNGAGKIDSNVVKNMLKLW